MNRSKSEHNSGQGDLYGSNDETRLTGRMEHSTGTHQIPTKITKRLVPGSWHGEKSSSSTRQNRPKEPKSSPSDDDSFRKSGSAHHTILNANPRRSRTSDCPGPPQESPGSSHSTIKRILSPNFLSPSISGPAAARHKVAQGELPLTGCTPDSASKKRSPSLLDKISTGTALIKEVPIPSIYKYARKCLWDDFALCLETATSRDVSFVYKKDGTTVMHMVVMSGTGYINAFKSGSKDFPVARLELLEKLLQLNREVANVKCSLNGYTPLTYACLVCNDKYDVENAAAMVRLILNYCPESVQVFSKDGLSPVDIHIVSYSHHHKDKEDASSLGRTSASVLRTLLTHSPELANNRLNGDKIKGPIELLYKCNSKAFSQAALDEIYEGDEEGTVKSDFTIPARRQKVVDTVKKWWIWTWAVMILKYGSLKQKKRGAQFAAVHAATMQMACPNPVLVITLYAFPRQIKQAILDKEDLENLPLHAVCSWPSGPSDKIASQSLLATRKSQAIATLLEEYPLAIKVTNGHGETALELAANTRTTWDGGIRRLVKAYPKALRVQSKRTGLYPFMAAAVAAVPSSSDEGDAQSLRTIYGLLRSNPKVLSQAWQSG